MTQFGILYSVPWLCHWLLLYWFDCSDTSTDALVPVMDIIRRPCQPNATHDPYNRTNSVEWPDKKVKSNEQLYCARINESDTNVAFNVNNIEKERDTISELLARVGSLSMDSSLDHWHHQALLGSLPV